MKEGYIRGATSTIPFVYELVDESSSFLKPIEEELEALQIAENMVVNEEVSLQAACDWLEYKTDRRMSCLLYTSPSPRDGLLSRMPSSA